MHLSITRHFINYYLSNLQLASQLQFPLPGSGTLSSRGSGPDPAPSSHDRSFNF
jgi:hypothetical protein